MKLLYLSAHSVLEFDELSLFTELGIDCFSLGAYTNPTISGDGKRPPIANAVFHPELYSTALQCSKEHLHNELVDWADIVYIMHNPKLPGQEIEQSWVVNNWPLLKNKRTIWRSIGQSIFSIEKELQQYKDQGLQIVRYSPRERTIPGYAGEDAIIRFYKDPEEYKDWNGRKKRVINFTQSLKQRGRHTGYEVFMKATEGFKRKVYGSGNEELHGLSGGLKSYEDQKKFLKNSRVYFYHGTAPASYTLSFIEAWMVGIPIVAAGPAFSRDLYDQDTNEIGDLIENGKNGFVSDNIDDLREYIKLLLENNEVAQRVGEEGRKSAISYFGKDLIKGQWRKFLFEYEK